MPAGEFAFIDWVRKRTPAVGHVLVGPGDDSAVLATPSRPLLVTTDMLLEGSCFRLSEAGPVRVGRKAIAVNLSDIADLSILVKRNVFSQHGKRDGAVHRSGVEIEKAEFLGEHFPERGLARSGRSVDGYDHLFRQGLSNLWGQLFENQLV